MAEQVILNGRCADLVVVGQPVPTSSPASTMTMVEQALFGSSVPVLVVPFAGHFDSIGRRVLIGWIAIPEAARALHNALPLMAGAETITVLSVERIAAADISAGESLLYRGAELQANLIVTGAYGHSRLREMILGGVMRTLLREMTVPVLMSH